MKVQDHSRFADGLTITAFFSYLGSWLVNATPVLQALALIVSIIAGLCAAFYHIRRTYKNQ